MTVAWDGASPFFGRIVIAPVGSPAEVVTDFFDVDGIKAGSHTFAGPPIGDYDIRLFNVLSQYASQRGPFRVYPRITATTTYLIPEFLEVSWVDSPSQMGDWIAIAPDGSSDDTVTMRVTTDGRDGIHAFGPLPPGTYRARYFDKDGHTKRSESAPVTIQRTFQERFLSISAGSLHACGVTERHTVRCWGRNANGRLGDGTTTDSETAVEVVGLADVVEVSAGLAHSCAIVGDGRVFCWGAYLIARRNDAGTTYYEDALTPVERPDARGALSISVSPGGYDNCALLPDSSVHCWGDLRQTVPIRGSTGAVQVRGGQAYGCALLRDRTVACWGFNGDWQAGVADAVAIDASSDHACAVIADGTVHCWGSNTFGKAGKEPGDAASPTAVREVKNAIGLATGSYHSCAVLADLTLRCWGEGGNGEFGEGVPVATSAAVAVPGTTEAISVYAGERYSCSLLRDRTAKCWGALTHFATEETDGFGDTIALAAGYGHTCASGSDGRVRCWGDNSYGQLGDGTTTPRVASVEVAAVRDVIALSANNRSTCALANARPLSSAQNSTQTVRRQLFRLPGLTQTVRRQLFRVRRLTQTVRRQLFRLPGLTQTVRRQLFRVRRLTRGDECPDCDRSCAVPPSGEFLPKRETAALRRPRRAGVGSRDTPGGIRRQADSGPRPKRSRAIPNPALCRTISGLAASPCAADGR